MPSMRPRRLKDDYNLFRNYYNVDGFGDWEHGNNILMRLIDDENFLATLRYARARKFFVIKRIKQIVSE